MMRRTIVVCMAMATLWSVAEAQVRMFPSREQLDSLVSPALSTAAQGLHTELIDRCIESDVQHFCFGLTNTTPSEVVVTRLVPTCSCIKTEIDNRRLTAGGSSNIELHLNTAGRSGKFRYEVLIYTSLDKERPSARLDIAGEIVANGSNSSFKEQLGGLGVSRKTVVIDNIVEGQPRIERIACQNLTEQPLRPTARTTVEGLMIATEPATLQAGEMGEIVIRYTGAVPEHDIATFAIVEGLRGAATERMLRIRLKANDR